MRRNQLQSIIDRDGVTSVRRAHARAFGLLFALTLAVIMVALNVGGVAYSATTAGGATATVKSTVGQVLEVLQDKQMSQASRQRKVLGIVANRFDFSDMARSSLGYNWKKLSPAQQGEFVPLFTAFMEDAYLNKVGAYSGQRVEYLGQTSIGANTEEVKTIVRPANSSNQPIRINYLLKLVGGDWKVYDVAVDDISITANYRNQFNRVINERGFSGLMSAMREKQEQLRQSIGA